jgi:2-C-methyl-D-erythritol 2,4-cyclodiphosphate synthase
MVETSGIPRVGLGFDVHPRGSGRVLMLGGLRWDGHDGLAGHSDGDVVCHAVADALLGACAQGDVGQHFPESDPEIAGIEGLELLSRTLAVVNEAGFSASSCDLTVICFQPAIAPRRDEIAGALAAAMDLGTDAVSVKATRPEGLGLQGDGIGCMAVAMVVPTNVPMAGGGVSA